MAGETIVRGAGPLTDLRVLDLSEGVAGPFATKLLSSLGADVITVEVPGRGDESRSRPPFLADDPHPEKSGLFLYLNTDKRSITLDLRQPGGQAIARKLIEWADIVVESFAPGQLQRWNIDYDSIEQLSPETILVSVSGYGQEGPYSAYEWSNLSALAMGGLLQITGDPDREPLKVGGRPAEYLGGLAAFSGAMVALYAQRATGEGQHVDVSLTEAVATAQMYSGLNYAYLGENRERVNEFAPTFRVQNGHVGVMYRQQNWADFCRMMERPDMIEDERFNDMTTRRTHSAELNEIVSAWMSTQEKRELYHRAQAQGMPFGYICNARDLIESPQYQHREYFVELDHPVSGRLTYPGTPLRWDGHAQPTDRAPLLGEHNGEVYNFLGYSDAEQVILRSEQII